MALEDLVFLLNHQVVDNFHQVVTPGGLVYDVMELCVEFEKPPYLLFPIQVLGPDQGLGMGLDDL